MSVPTTNLYDFVHQSTESNYRLYCFYPWGHKEFKNIIIFNPVEDPAAGTSRQTQWQSFITGQDVTKAIICHDQEPLDFDMYNDTNFKDNINDIFVPRKSDGWNWSETTIQNFTKHYKNLNLRWSVPNHCHTHWILLHSELNSLELQKYEDTGLFKGAYWWSHAIIARDWYRFAEHDRRLSESHNKVANWLVYARDTTGKRQYRKRFLDMLRFVSNVQLGSIDNDAVVTSNSSAEYNHEDHTKTNCSIVLETVFDNRIHLTEKTLRPIACGHPFIILSGQGTLKYLRSYGFKTFDPFINESYDLVTDPNERMLMVLTEMDRINNLPQSEQERIWKACAVIARHNKELFFSDRFFNTVKHELYNNVKNIEEPIIDLNLLKKSLLIKAKDPDKKRRNHRQFELEIYLHLKKRGNLDEFVV